MVVQQTFHGAVKDVLSKISLLSVPIVATWSKKAVKSKYRQKFIQQAQPVTGCNWKKKCLVFLEEIQSSVASPHIYKKAAESQMLFAAESERKKPIPSCSLIWGSELLGCSSLMRFGFMAFSCAAVTAGNPCWGLWCCPARPAPPLHQLFPFLEQQWFLSSINAFFTMLQKSNKNKELWRGKSLLLHHEDWKLFESGVGVGGGVGKWTSSQQAFSVFCLSSWITQIFLHTPELCSHTFMAHPASEAAFMEKSRREKDSCW